MSRPCPRGPRAARAPTAREKSGCTREHRRSICASIMSRAAASLAGVTTPRPSARSVTRTQPSLHGVAHETRRRSRPRARSTLHRYRRSSSAPSSVPGRRVRPRTKRGLFASLKDPRLAHRTISRAVARNSAPLDASRTAEVATSSPRVTRASSHSRGRREARRRFAPSRRQAASPDASTPSLRRVMFISRRRASPRRRR